MEQMVIITGYNSFVTVLKMVPFFGLVHWWLTQAHGHCTFLLYGRINTSYDFGSSKRSTDIMRT